VAGKSQKNPLGERHFPIIRINVEKLDLGNEPRWMRKIEQKNKRPDLRHGLWFILKYKTKIIGPHQSGARNSSQNTTGFNPLTIFVFLSGARDMQNSFLEEGLAGGVTGGLGNANGES